MRHKVLIFAFFIFIIILITFPLVFKITTHIPGFFSTDESYAVIWNAWRIKFSILNNLSLKRTNLIAYPFGFDFYTNQLIGYLWAIINFTLAVFLTPVLTYNILAIFNFILAAFFNYLLVYYLTKSRLCAVLSGIILGFSPFIFMRSWQHLGETYLWPLPLFLWSMFRLRKSDLLRLKILFVLSFLFSSINFSGTYYALIMVAVFLIYLMNNIRENLKYLKRIIVLLAFSFLILLPQFFPVFKNVIFSKQGLPSAFNIYRRPFEDLFAQSAKPLSYLLPATVHPVFGKFTEQFIGSPLYGVSFTEHTLYLGWVPIILSLIAVRQWRKRRDFYIGFFVFLAIVAWFFSQPPWWKFGPIKIYMPSFFMYKILPMFRAYCRFGIVLMLAVAVLAGFGLKHIISKIKNQKSKILVTGIFCGLVLFEFWNWPPYKVIDVSKVPAVYYWLKEQPSDFVIAEYPLDADSPSEMYKFYQTKHEKKIINGTIPGTEANRIAKTLTKLSKESTTRKLKEWGVKYAVVHRDGYLETELIEEKIELEKIPKNPDLLRIKSFPAQECPQKNIMCVQKTGPIDVYEVVAQAAEF